MTRAEAVGEALVAVATAVRRYKSETASRSVLNWRDCRSPPTTPRWRMRCGRAPPICAASPARRRLR